MQVQSSFAVRIFDKKSAEIALTKPHSDGILLANRVERERFWMKKVAFALLLCLLLAGCQTPAEQETSLEEGVSPGQSAAESSEGSVITEISLPEEGRTFYEYTDKNDVLYAFHVDNVDCTAGTSNVTIMLSGTKTECLYGNDYLAACKVIYKLFDSEGYVVASGYIDTIRLTVGDSVRNAKITLSGLDEWESYILELYDIYPIPSTTTE